MRSSRFGGVGDVAADRPVAGINFAPCFAASADPRAFTAGLSIRVTWGGSAQSTRAAKMRGRSPHWLRRFNTMVYGPHSGGETRRRQPPRSPWAVPLIIRRSFACRGPVCTIGRCGSMAARRSSFSRDRPDTVHAPPFGTVNRRNTPTSIEYRPQSRRGRRHRPECAYGRQRCALISGLYAERNGQPGEPGIRLVGKPPQSNHQLTDHTSRDRVDRTPGVSVQPARVGLVRNPPFFADIVRDLLAGPGPSRALNDHCSEADGERGLRPAHHLDTPAPTRPKRRPPAPTGEGPCRN